MMNVSVRSNIDEITGWMNRVSRQQLPFATSVALNDTAFDVRRQIVDRTMPRAFKLKNKRFPSAAMRVRKSTKRKLRAGVYDRLGREYLVTQATGGIKRPRGRHIAVPQGVRRTSTGKISKANRPRQLLNKPNAFKITSGGKSAIYTRRRGKGGGLEFQYALVNSARIPRRLRFYEDAQRTIKQRFPRRFKVAFARAKLTARRR
tara:strand:+ start:3570 stop:4181 length:612 start_codon:yes stop_codon:yes gene_type:complete